MHQVISVSLNDNAYQIEEGGYAALREYLNRAKARLRNNPDVDEILADLERAIAEKCSACLGPSKTVVRSTEIAGILSDIGPVAGDATGDEPPIGDTASTTAQADAHETYSGPRKLYKIRSGQKLWGVCNGLAAYFDLDVTILRLTFVLLTIFTTGLWILAYALMALVIPYGAPDPNYRQPSGGNKTARNVILVAAACAIALSVFLIPIFDHGFYFNGPAHMIWPGMWVMAMLVGLIVIGILLFVGYIAITLLRNVRSNSL